VPYLAVAFLTLLLLIPAEPVAAQVQPEVYASGMRNPYRWSFDRQTGDMYIGDVGGSNEEITFLPAAQSRGANLGWNCFSGTATESGCTPTNYFPPAYQYPSGPDVVIGGYVVRDPALPSFAGRYLFGRFSSGSIVSLGPGASPPAVDTNLDVPSVSGFGEDGEGHLYATSLGGQVYRLGESGGALTKSSIGSFDQPVAVAAQPGDSSQLFIVEKPGRIQRWTPSGTTEFLDISSRVQTADAEEGLLALAVSPDYATSHRIFVFYVDDGSDLQLDEYRDGARTPVATIQHDQASNHNGGQLLFGPDGALYLSTGDGGTQGDPEGDAQNPASLLGKILRFDVGAPPAVPADTIAPALSVRVPRRQRVLRLRGAVAYVRCSEACTVSVGGTLRIGNRKLLLRRTTGAAQASPRKRLKVRIRKRSARLLRRALANGRRPRVQVRLRAQDAAGNRSAARRSLRVRR
jgi:glucose/arabinose dehydrogenase